MMSSLEKSYSQVLAGGLVALFCGFVFAAVTVFGVISAVLGHIFLLLATIVGSILIVSEIIPFEAKKHKIIWVAFLVTIMGIADYGIVHWKRSQAANGEASGKKTVASPTPPVEQQENDHPTKQDQQSNNPTLSMDDGTTKSGGRENDKGSADRGHATTIVKHHEQSEASAEVRLEDVASMRDSLCNLYSSWKDDEDAGEKEVRESTDRQDGRYTSSFSTEWYLRKLQIDHEKQTEYAAVGGYADELQGNVTALLHRPSLSHVNYMLTPVEARGMRLYCEDFRTIYDAYASWRVTHP